MPHPDLSKAHPRPQGYGGYSAGLFPSLPESCHLQQQPRPESPLCIMSTGADSHTHQGHRRGGGESIACPHANNAPSGAGILSSWSYAQASTCLSTRPQNTPKTQAETPAVRLHICQNHFSGPSDATLFPAPPFTPPHPTFALTLSILPYLGSEEMPGKITMGFLDWVPTR